MSDDAGRSFDRAIERALDVYHGGRHWHDRFDAVGDTQIRNAMDAACRAYVMTLIEDELGDMPDRRRCRLCGCTDAHACVTDGIPCHWVDHDLCSACAAAAGAAGTAP